MMLKTHFISRHLKINKFLFYEHFQVKSAAYYQQLQLQQQQEAQSYNQRQPGGLGYANQNNENIYMPRILKNYDEHESSPRMYPPHAQFEQQQQQQNNSYEPQLSPSRYEYKLICMYIFLWK